MRSKDILFTPYYKKKKSTQMSLLMSQTRKYLSEKFYILGTVDIVFKLPDVNNIIMVLTDIVHFYPFSVPHPL